MMAANKLLIRPRSGRTVPLSSYVLAVLWGAYSCRLFRIDYPLNFCWSWPNWSWHCQIPCSVLVMERYSISGILRPEGASLEKMRKFDWIRDTSTRASLNAIRWQLADDMVRATAGTDMEPHDIIGRDESRRKKRRAACQLAPTHRGQGRNWSWTTGRYKPFDHGPRI